jgi:hypothetical protein
LLSAIFLIGGIGMISSLAGLGPSAEWLASLPRNWLMIIFSVNVPATGVEAASLQVPNAIDLAIMFLFAIMLFPLYSELRHSSRALSMIAACLPVLGILVFLATGVAGRSALLVSGLLISIAQLRGSLFGRASAYLGISAGALLFFGGDIATAIVHSSVVVAALVAVGYVLWIAWLVSIGAGLVRQRPASRTPKSR